MWPSYLNSGDAPTFKLKTKASVVMYPGAKAMCTETQQPNHEPVWHNWRRGPRNRIEAKHGVALLRAAKALATKRTTGAGTVTNK